MMELTFALAIAACMLFLYVPGFFLFRALGFNGFRSLAIAPVASVAAYCILGIALPRVDIACSWMSVALPVTAVFLVLFLVRMCFSRGKHAISSSAPTCINWWVLLWYLLVGVAVCVYVYVIPLGDPMSFLEEYDNGFHMQVTRAFADSGNWSVLEVSKYLTAEDLAIVPIPGTSFYPALWHELGAMLISLLGCPVAVAVNAVNFVMAGILFPLGVMASLDSFFKNRRKVLLGAPCSLAFVGFPWLMLFWGPLYANALGFALTPLAASLFILMVDSWSRRSMRFRHALALVVAIFVLAVAQPSSVFTCVVLLAPYCVYRIWVMEENPHLGKLAISRKLLAVLFVVFVILVWTAFVFAPFMHSVVFDFDWGLSRSPVTAVCSVILLMNSWFPLQCVLAAVVIIGVLSTLVHRKFLWLTIAWVLFGLIYVVGTSVDGVVRHFLAGFWYTDPVRLFACIIMAAIPLAVQGLSTVCDVLHRFLKNHTWVYRIVVVTLLAVFCIVVYRPGFWWGDTYVDSAFGKMRWEFKNGNDHDRAILFDSDEERFVNEVLEVIPEGALVANMPDDGSGFAYPATGLRTYYRDYRDYESEKVPSKYYETPESKLIRLGADQIATSDEVRAAFKNVGIEYVLVLDQGESFAEQPKLYSYDPDLWTGLAAIDDDTPGFTVVLADGDMRLYRIDV